MSNECLNVGLIGVGRIGKLHAEHLAYRLPGVRLKTIADVNAGAAQACATRLGVPVVSSDYHAILEDRDIQAVVICSPTNTHAQIVVEAAGAGKHIFCEKPIDLALDRVDQALAAVGQAGVRLQLGFNRRFDANFARVRRAIASGEVGTLRFVHIVSRDPAPPPIEYVKVSGGIFMDMTIHDFDMARFLVGDEVEEVYVSGGVMVDPAIGEVGDIDTALTVLRFRSGVIGTIDNCRQAVYGYDQRVEAFGSKGSIQTDNNYANSAIIASGQSVGRDLPLNFFMERYTESFLAEMRAFVDAVLNGKPVPVTGEDARKAMLIGLAARRSYETKRPEHVFSK
ncbi:MAG: inositol 2-dehydrogenase [Candidatus Hydrogenedentes bacterium]|nr:inositol 2-dehydrogenase [Candidatus Hydrogenedentota bacterium]